VQGFQNEDDFLVAFEYFLVGVEKPQIETVGTKIRVPQDGQVTSSRDITMRIILF
jgi:hypothetical protein